MGTNRVFTCLCYNLVTSQYLFVSYVCRRSELSASDEDSTWISWFVSLRGNEFFCEVRASTAVVVLYVQYVHRLSFVASRFLVDPSK